MVIADRLFLFFKETDKERLNFGTDYIYQTFTLQSVFVEGKVG